MGSWGSVFLMFCGMILHVQNVCQKLLANICTPIPLVLEPDTRKIKHESLVNEFYVVTCSYSSCPFLCALGLSRELMALLYTLSWGFIL